MQKQKLANRVFALISDSTQMTRQWMVYLIDKKLDEQGGLRNRIFAIFVIGLIDSVEEPENRIRGLEHEAKRLGNEAASYYLDCMRCYLKYVVRMMSLYTRREIIFLTEQRNQLVHGLLTETHKEKRSVRWVRNGSLVREKIPSEVYWAEWREVFEAYRGVDNTLAALRSRFYACKTLFWTIDAVLRHRDVWALMHKDLHSGLGPSVAMKFPDNPEAIELATQVHGMSLLEYRSLATIEGDTSLDSVVESGDRETKRMQDKAKAASNLISGATGDWEVIVGLEVHAQVASRSKLFSGSSTAFGAEPNSHVSLVDAAMPGMLPVINEECIAQAIRTGLGLKAAINLKSVFDRKNYFYPDLPQGYQISQYKQPVVGEGEVEIDVDGETKRVGIERLHLEQDAGKSIHDQHPDYSYVDLNRSGVALMEIVSKPDMRSAKEAQAYVSKLRTILRYLGTSDADMEKGNLRADVNVSVRKPGDKLGTRCEIKNVNSIRFIGQAIEVEARRQIDILEDGGKIDQETRLFDAAKGETRSMRSKEEAHDYRYFPDPDLLPLEFTQGYVDELKKGLPELPDEKKHRFMKAYGLSAYDADVLIAERESADFFEAVAKGRDGKAPDLLASGKTAANWVINELFGRLNKEGKDIEHSPVSARQLGSIVDLISSGTISGKIAKDLFEIVWTEGGDPAGIVEARGMKQVTDTGAIEKAVDEIIAANPDKVEQAKAKPSMLGWFVGQVMKGTGGKANPAAVNEILKKKLGI